MDNTKETDRDLKGETTTTITRTKLRDTLTVGTTATMAKREPEGLAVNMERDKMDMIGKLQHPGIDRKGTIIISKGRLR